MIRIIIGWWFWITNRNNALAKSRLSICSNCEYRKWFVCSRCGCPLQAKSRLVDEQCPHPKGNQWEYIDYYYKVHPLKLEKFQK